MLRKEGLEFKPEQEIKTYASGWPSSEGNMSVKGCWEWWFRGKSKRQNRVVVSKDDDEQRGKKALGLDDATRMGRQ